MLGKIRDPLTVVIATASHGAAEMLERSREAAEGGLSPAAMAAVLDEARQSFIEIADAASRVEGVVSALSSADSVEPPAPPPAGLPVPRVLIVDDEPAILRMLGRMLDDYAVECVENAENALKLIEAGSQFDAIVCDVVMPGMTGPELYERLLRQFPSAAQCMVFVTAGSDNPRGNDLRRLVPNRFLDKPFPAAQLFSAIDEARTRKHGERPSLLSVSR